MFKHIRFNILILLLIICTPIFSQNFEEHGIEKEFNIYRFPSIELSVGQLSFFGDVNDFNNIPFIGKHNSSYGINIQQRLGNTIGISLGGLKGKLTGLDTRPGSYHNFQTELVQGDFNLYLHLDNGIIFSKSSIVAPYLKAGIGFIRFEPKGDLYDKNGNRYHYWKDGTIRDTPFDKENPQIGNHISRDYVYETTLDSLNLFDKTAMIMPLGGGIKFKLSDYFEANLALTYIFTNTNHIDNIALENKSYPLFNKNNDNYLYSSVSLQLNLGGYYKKVKLESQYNKVVFAHIDAIGVENTHYYNYYCLGIPAGIKVDAFGCPIDTDGDGIPDYLDKEPNTTPGAIVNEHGVALSNNLLRANELKQAAIINNNIIIYYMNRDNPPAVTKNHMQRKNEIVFSYENYPYKPDRK